MIRRRNAILLALGLLAPLALVDAPAGAVDQDLVADVTAGAPGTVVTLTSASCASPSEGEASLEASLFVGTAPDQQIAAFAQAFEGSATLTVPDWVDPDQPAVIQATCHIYTYDGSGDEDFAYDPISFDVEPGAGTPVQVRTFSRSELLAGQGTLVTGSCGPALGNSTVMATVGEGTDQTGEDLGNIAGRGYGETDADGSFELELFVTNAHVSIGIETSGDEVTALDVEETPIDIPAGDYTAFVYCSEDSEDTSLQFLQPEPLVVTGTAATDGSDLTNAEGTPDVTLAGTCDAGEVSGTFDAYSLDDFNGFDAPLDAVRTNRFATARAEGDAAGPASTRPGAGADLVRTTGGTARALTGDGFSEFTAQPAGDGTWQVSDTVGFDQGIVVAVAYCGDPMADGYVYDPQGVGVIVEEPTTTTTTTTTTAPAPAPANAVAGTPTYAG